MAVVITIGGVTRQHRLGTLSFRQPINGRHTASFQLDSMNRSVRPALDAEVVIQEDGTTTLAGLIDQPRERGLIKGTHPGISTQVNVVDFHAYTEWRFINADFPEQTLKARLQALIADPLTDYGVTLHGSQVDGPTLPPVSYDYMRLDAVLNEQMKLTADFGQPFVWRIDYSKVLRAFQPSTQAAPFNLVGDSFSKTRVIGDITVEPSNQGKANRVIVKVVPKEEQGHVESFTGDGVTTTYDLTFTLQAPFTTGVIHRYEPDGVTPSGAETIAITGTDTATQWEISTDGTQITRVAGPTENLYIYRLTYNGIFQGEWTATDASWTSTPSSRRQKVIQLESIIDDAAGQAFADAELAKSLTGPITVRYTTREKGILPGQSQTVTVSTRNVNEAGVVTEIAGRDFARWESGVLQHRIERSVTVIVDDTQTNLDRTAGDAYRIWFGDKTGTSQGPTVSAVSGTGAAPPLESVQTNESGALAGKATFLFKRAKNSLICGLDNSITAANYESCAVFGTNNHIADP